MNAPLQIAFHNVEGSEEVKDLIEEKVDWLGRVYDRITACRVVVEGPSPRRRPSCPYRVRIDLAVPGGSVVVSRALPSRAVDRGLDTVVREAFDVARRRLEAYARRMRHEVKSHEPAPHAIVSRLFEHEGYGFLATPEGREIYFHQNAVNGGFGRLHVGDEVVFCESAGDKGPQASCVRMVS